MGTAVPRCGCGTTHSTAKLYPIQRAGAAVSLIGGCGGGGAAPWYGVLHRALLDGSGSSADQEDSARSGEIPSGTSSWVERRIEVSPTGPAKSSVLTEPFSAIVWPLGAVVSFVNVPCEGETSDRAGAVRPPEEPSMLPRRIWGSRAVVRISLHSPRAGAAGGCHVRDGRT